MTINKNIFYLTEIKLDEIKEDLAQIEASLGEMSKEKETIKKYKKYEHE